MIRRRQDPDAIGLFVGNGAFPNASVVPLHYEFMAALGFCSRFTTATVDQCREMTPRSSPLC